MGKSFTREERANARKSKTRIAKGQKFALACENARFSYVATPEAGQSKATRVAAVRQMRRSG